MQKHKHSFTYNLYHMQDATDSGIGAYVNVSPEQVRNTRDTSETGTGNSGNLQPYLVVNYIIKATQTTPTFASVVNTNSNSTTDSYSCDYVNNAINPLQIYGVETKIGKWFNKDLYRQCFEITYTGGNVKILDFNYGQYVKSMKAMLVRTDGYCSEISWNSPSASSIDFGILYVNYQNNAIMFNSSFTGTIYLTVEYTKN